MVTTALTNSGSRRYQKSAGSSGKKLRLGGTTRSLRLRQQSRYCLLQPTTAYCCFLLCLLPSAYSCLLLPTTSWQRIDILMTHVPPLGFFDRMPVVGNWGSSAALLAAVKRARCLLPPTDTNNYCDLLSYYCLLIIIICHCNV